MIVAIIFAAMIATWLFLASRFKLPPNVGFEMDVVGQPYSFFSFHDRYATMLRYVGWLTVIALVGSLLEHDGRAAQCLVAALIDNVVLQAWMLYSYECFCQRKYAHHGEAVALIASPYTAKMYAAMLTLALGLTVFFGLGLVLALVNA